MQRHMPQEPAMDAEPDCSSGNGAEHSIATMPAGSLQQGLGQTNYPGQTGRFMRVFARIFRPLLPPYQKPDFEAYPGQESHLCGKGVQTLGTTQPAGHGWYVLPEKIAAATRGGVTRDTDVI